MLCPNCARKIPDDARSCPFCGAAAAAAPARGSGGALRWCPSCGALVPPAAAACPKCGTPVKPVVPGAGKHLRPRVPEETRAEAPRGAARAEAPRGAAHAAPVEAAEPAGPALESALPPRGAGAQTPAARLDHMPRVRHLAFAAAAAVLIVGGAALAITHPWDAAAGSTHATVPYDTSGAGFPGLVESLTAQDKTSGSGSSDASSDPIYDALLSDYEQLSDLAARADSSEEALAAASGTADGESGLSDARSLAIDVSNLISAIQSTSDGAGAYTETIANLGKLGSWLRNRVDALTAAWQSVASGNPAEVPSDSATYKRLFDDNYAAWEPASAR